MGIEALYRQTAFLYRQSFSSDQYGGQVASLTHYATARCFCTALSGKTGQVGKPVFAGQQQVIATHRLFVAPLRVKSSDRVYVAENDQWYNVLFVDNCSGLGHHYELLLEYIGEQDVEPPWSAGSSSSSSESSGSSSSPSSQGSSFSSASSSLSSASSPSSLSSGGGP